MKKQKRNSGRSNFGNDPNRFLLFGITYLLATPSQFAQEIVDFSNDLDADIRAWLTEAGVTDHAVQSKAIAFVKAAVKDPAVYSFMNGLRAALQGPFSATTTLYDGHQCPIEGDSKAMIGALAKLK
jgi:hypothetical protein